MSYSQDIKNGKPRFTAETLVAGSTGEIDLEGGTLVGVLLEGDITSTSFKIHVARKAGGTFVIVKDPLDSGSDETFTIAGTATGYYFIEKKFTEGFRFCKLVFSASETPTVYISKRNFQ